MFFEFDNLLVDFLHFGCFFGSIDQQLGSFLLQRVERCLRFGGLLCISLSQCVGSAWSLGGMKCRLRSAAFVPRFQQLLVQSGETLNNNILLLVKREDRMAFGIVHQLLFVFTDVCLQIGDTFLQERSRALVRLGFFLQVLVPKGVGNCINDLCGYHGIGVLETDVNEAGLLVETAAAFSDGLDMEPHGNHPDKGSQPRCFLQILRVTVCCLLRRECQLIVRPWQTLLFFLTIKTDHAQHCLPRRTFLTLALEKIRIMLQIQCLHDAAQQPGAG